MTVKEANQVISEGVFDIHPRYQRLAASASMRTLWDALVELITNSHDSYGNLGEPTRIKIVAHSGRNDNRFIRLHDRAEGMAPDEMFAKLTKPGKKFGTSTSRGFMGRGAKDIVALGPCDYETIHNGVYSRLLLKADFSYKRFRPRPATKTDRDRLGIPKNGTVVTVRPKRSVSLPRFDNLFVTDSHATTHFATSSWPRLTIGAFFITLKEARLRSPY